MSFIRPELAARLHHWREPIGWAALLAAGAPARSGAATPGSSRSSSSLGLLLAAAGLGLLRAALRRLRLSSATLSEGVVVIDEARIAYLGPRDGGFVDLPSVTRVEIVSRPHLPARLAARLGDHRRGRHPPDHPARRRGRRRASSTP